MIISVQTACLQPAWIHFSLHLFATEKHICAATAELTHQDAPGVQPTQVFIKLLIYGQVLSSHQGFPSDCMQIPNAMCLLAKQDWKNLVFQEVKIGREDNAAAFHVFPKGNIFSMLLLILCVSNDAWVLIWLNSCMLLFDFSSNMHEYLCSSKLRSW